MKKTILAVTAICLAAVLLCGAGCYAAVNYIDRHPAEAAPSLSTPAPAPADAEGLKVSTLARASAGGELSATEIYQLACKQVVGISTTVTGYNMFGQLTKNAVSGTGFIISEDGYILTNNHVVEGAKDVTVKLNDGSEYAAEIVGVEGRDSDVAVLKIEASGLTPVTLGNSDAMEVGENIYVVGNPLGELTYTMTSGIISALDREIATDRNVNVNMFQLDAAVNAGNSGGPVYDAQGRVLGIVTAKYQSTGIEGLGFAIPINDAVEIARELIDHGYVTGKAYFGIVVTNMSETDAQRYNSKAGVYVTTVTEGSCAEKAGMQQGDVILELGGKAVANTTELASVKKDYKAGDSCEVTVWRSGKTLKLTVIFDEEPAQTEDVPAAAQEEPREAPADEWGYGNDWDYGGGSGWDSMWDSFFGRFFDYYGDQEDTDREDSGDGRGSFHHYGS
ncbi:MAG: trypsin-like peptidase domain-containing protein [Oscillospiraceae bacterium]|nr:trypsin-like peptidase domain-containing protein [Oscillospiraceae bacterium]